MIQQSRKQARDFFVEFEVALRLSIEDACEVFDKHTTPLSKLSTMGSHKLIGLPRAPLRVHEFFPRYDEVFAEIRKILTERYGEERMRSMMVGLTW